MARSRCGKQFILNRRKNGKRTQPYQKGKKRMKNNVKQNVGFRYGSGVNDDLGENVREHDVEDIACQPLELLLSTFSKDCEENGVKNEPRKILKCCDFSKLVEKERDEILVSDVHLESVNSDECRNENNVNKIGKMTALCERETNAASNAMIDVEHYSFNNEESNSDCMEDPFISHFCYDLSANLLETLTLHPVKSKRKNVCWPNLNCLEIEIPKIEENDNLKMFETNMMEEHREFAKLGDGPKMIGQIDWDKLCIKTQIQKNIKEANKNHLGKFVNDELTGLQKEIFSIIYNYQDFFYPGRNSENGEQIRFIYCLHVVNHILKTRSRILRHNEKLSQREVDFVPEEFRDQGLVRPKVIILVPFKESCLRIVNTISSILLKEDCGNIINKTRFEEEFSSSELFIPRKNSKPEDYRNLFEGNIDDKFKIGIGLTKKSLKLYADFYSSDIIIASPLGLRLVVGAEGDSGRDFDFLSSIEILILDQTELFLMQNWDHLLLVFEHLHIQPKMSHGTDFSRIRSWVLNGWSKFYRQTLIFSSITTPELNSIFNRRCCNYAGKIRVLNPVHCGAISQVITQLSHVFQKFEAESILVANEARFKFFIKKILHQYKDPNLNGILIYVPSYFDYVSIRNYLKREDYNFVQICEYSKADRVARARDKFFHNEARFLLYSERFHFFRRIKLKGIRHIIFYQLPTFPHFYSELCNFLNITDKEAVNYDIHRSVAVLYCKYDMHQLSGIIKTSRALKLLSSEKNIHMFSTG